MDIQLEQKKRIRLKHVIYVIVSTVLILVLWNIFFTNRVSTYRTEKEKLSIHTITYGKFDDYITINGVVAPIATIYMDAYEGGRVTEKLMEEGAMVQEGDIILRLENSALYEQILSSESNLALKQNDLRSTKLTFDSRQIEGKKALVNAQYNLQQSKRKFKQNKELYDEELISKDDYLTSKENYELSKKQFDIIKLQTEQDIMLRRTSLSSLDSDLKRMKKTLSMVYERIDHLNVKAPSNGQLGYLDAEIGQNLSQGQRIGQINVLTNYKIKAFIDEHYIERVQLNLTAIFERNGKQYQLRLRKVYPEVRNGKFKVDLVFINNKPETIRAGQTYNIKLQLGESSEALLLPKGSFFQSTGGQWIFVVTKDEKEALQRKISIGNQNSKYYKVIDGLQVGEKVITSNYDYFGNAKRIVIK